MELNDGCSFANDLQLKDLLTLKQQQAGVIEAREAVEQGKETLKQGRSIILFTVVTMVFVSRFGYPLCLITFLKSANHSLI